MSYSLKWSPKAVKELRKLPKEAAQRLVERIDLAKDNPHHFLLAIPKGKHWLAEVL